jgi:hypothetical protein
MDRLPEMRAAIGKMETKFFDPSAILKKSPPKRANSKAHRTNPNQCRAAGIDGGWVRSNCHPAVVDLQAFSALPAAVDHHPLDGRHLAVAEHVSILPFFVYSFVSSSYLSQGINALLDCEVPANFGVPTLRVPLFGSHRPIADRWTTAY